MHDALQSLSEREKETLRLLASGHDAKSAASHLALSVHTVNERLRSARQKLGVSSSRAAARRLMDIEDERPKFLGDMKLGEGLPPDDVRRDTHHHQSQSLVWWIGGLVIMLSFAIAALIFTNAANPHTPAPQPAVPAQAAQAGSVSPEGPASALAWVTLLDHAQWNESWSTAGQLFRSQLTQAGWATSVQSVRASVGPVVTRVQENATRTSTLPGLPSGDYLIVQYRTTFRDKASASETVVLTHERTGWKVDGYFIR
ncbi:DNA-binding CsgD family transcriptional regulator [Brevundimonas nasdae]|uniref:helix-turn-helix domain-containing protein n=1 Tax=Brevundimonas nasdae TaxID=172043 RepID=UPI001914C6A2|nr:DUF4019 domain-containing protein [Brevundimonas nasdae]MBK6025302.1 DUF4019 domain-containing protein [Brevundimonas nasdae]MDQ0451916.1 DNA-binding CsgD family transcriptional regulator [Brevundimonas nasdae]